MSTYYHTLRTKLAQSDESALASPLKWGAGLGAIGTAAGAGVGLHKDMAHMGANVKGLTSSLSEMGRDYQRFKVDPGLLANRQEHIRALDNYFSDMRRSGRKFNPNTLSTLGLDSAKKTIRHYDDAYEGLRRTRFAHADAGAYTQKFKELLKLKNTKKWAGRAGLAGLGLGAGIGLYNTLKKESSDYEVKFTGEYNHNHLLDGKMKTDLPDLLQKKIIDYRRKKVAVSQGAMYKDIKEKGHNSALGTGGLFGIGGAGLGVGIGAMHNNINNVRNWYNIKHLERLGTQLKRIGKYGLAGGLGLGAIGAYKQYSQNRDIEDMADSPEKIKAMYDKFQNVDKLMRAQGVDLENKKRRYL